MLNKSPITKLLIQSSWLLVILFSGCGGRIILAQPTPLIGYAVTTDPTPGGACTAFGILELNTKNGNSWVCPSNTAIWTLFNAGGGGGSTAWGAIIGTLANQTDLANALNGKQATGNYLVDPGANSLVFRSSLNTTRAAVAADVSGLFTGSSPCFLNKDGTCSNPSGTGNVSNSGTPTVNQVATWVDATHIQGVPALTKAQQFATTVYTDQANTFGAFLQNFSAGSVIMPVSASAAPTVAGQIAFDSITHTYQVGNGTSTLAQAYFIGGPPTTGNCVTVGAGSYQLTSITCPGGGNVSNTGTPTSGQYAKWINATTIQGVTGVPGADLTGSRTVPQTTLPLGTTGAPGILRPDGTTITVDGSGIISLVGGSATATKIVSGLLSGLPGTCAAGDVYFATDQPAAEQLYQCSALNTYTQTFLHDTTIVNTVGSFGVNLSQFCQRTNSCTVAALHTFTPGIDITPTVVGSLGTCNGGTEGRHWGVTDANTTITLGIGTTVVGGGANHVPVYCDGTHWVIN